MHTSYWEQEVFHKPYDVIIVGAGITGSSTALELRKMHPNLSILMLERHFYPTGASTRNAGFACFGSVSELLDDLEHAEEDTVKALVQKRFEGLKVLRDTVPAEVMDFSMCGGHELFTDSKQYDSCAQAVARFNSWMEEIAGEKEVYKTDTVNGYPVIFNKLEGYLHSGKLMKWLHTQIHEAGIEIRWGSRVKSVRSGVVGLENDIQLHAKTIILATNGFSKEIEHHAPITPARGYILLTNELSDMPWKGTWHYDKGFVYFRNIGNRLLLGGARNVDVTTEETTDDSVNPLIKAHLIQFLMETLKLKGWAVEQEWTGIMGFGPNKTPTCLEIKPGVWLAGGLSGMGVALGMQFGKDVAHTIDI